LKYITDCIIQDTHTGIEEELRRGYSLTWSEIECRTIIKTKLERTEGPGWMNLKQIYASKKYNSESK